MVLVYHWPAPPEFPNLQSVAWQQAGGESRGAVETARLPCFASLQRISVLELTRHFEAETRPS